MTDEIPIACALGAQQLSGRLAEMAAIGRDSLLAVDQRRGRAAHALPSRRPDAPAVGVGGSRRIAVLRVSRS